jgi:outer membrane protein assembly factor BamB
LRRFGWTILVPVCASALAAAALILWLWKTEVTGLAERLPGATEKYVGPEGTKGAVQATHNPGKLTRGTGKPSSDTGVWAQFRGEARTNIAPASEKLLRRWPASGPKVLWRLTVGEGHAAPVIRSGRVYFIDYDMEKQEDAIRCLSLADGAEIWRYSYYNPVKRYHGMSRTIPAVTDDYVVAIGPLGHVHCLSAKTGELVWKMDLVKEFKTKIPEWYAGQCPLIDGNSVILAPGGDPLMMSVTLADGKINWRTPNPGGWGMTHSSIMPMVFAGTKMYVYCTTRGVVGVDAAAGNLLWTYPGWKITAANVPTPVPVGADRIFFTGGFEAGALMVRLTKDGDKIAVEKLFSLKPSVFGSDQQTPILYQDHIYGVIPGGRLACLDLDGKQVWTSGGAVRFALGPYMMADGLLLVLDAEDGVLRLVEPNPSGYKELAHAKVLEGPEAWGPMALAGGKLIVRDLTHMVCLEVGTNRP